jgi:hypothetical protein
MYEEVKLDTEANTPDRYAGVGNSRTMATTKTGGPIEFPRKEVLSDKLKSLEAGFSHHRSAKDLEAGLGQRVHDVEEGLGNREKEFEADFGRRVHGAEEGVQNREKDLEAGMGERIHSAESGLGDRAHGIQSSLGHKVRELEHFGNRLKDLASEIGLKAKETANEAEAHGSIAVKEAETAAEHGKRIADQGHVVGHVDLSLSGAERAGTYREP